MNKLSPGQLIKEARHALGYSVNDMAEALRVGNRLYRRWEDDNPSCPISGPAIVALAGILREAGRDKLSSKILEIR